MKDKLITEIQVSMASMLNASQLEELRRVLTNSLHGIEVTEKKAYEPNEAKDNEGLPPCVRIVVV